MARTFSSMLCLRGHLLGQRIRRQLAWLMLAGAASAAPAQAAEDEIAALKRQIAVLAERVQALERQAALTAAATEAGASAAPPPVPASLPASAALPDPAPAVSSPTPKPSPRVELGSSGFSVTSPDTNYVFRLRGLLQTDFRGYASAPVDEVVNDTFLIRRARPILEGTTFGRLDYRLMLDFPSQAALSTANNALVQDAYGLLRLAPGFQIQAGKFKEPVGLERLQSSANLLFIERGYPSQLVPNRDVGVQVQGDLVGNRLRYEAGVFNGVADGGSGDFETGSGDKDLAVRLFSRPFRGGGVAALEDLGVGMAGTYGRQDGTLRSFTSTGAQRFFRYRQSSDPTRPNVLSDGEHWRLAPQACYYVGPFGMLAEYVVSATTVRQAGGGMGAGQTGRLEHGGWQVAASYFLTGERNSYRSVAPGRPVTLAEGGGWGAWELAGRVGSLDLDPEAFPVFADPAVAARRALAFGLGVNWHLNRNLKLSLNYEHTRFDAEAYNPYAAADENLLLVRAQVAF